MDKKTIFFWIVVGIIFLLRLVNINEALYDDEANFAYSLTVMDAYGFNSDFPSPQLFHVLYKPFIFLFGLETWVFRLVPLMFGFLNLLLVYVLAKRNFGLKAARWSAFFMLVGFYPTLASLQIDPEGGMITFFILLLFFSYFEYRRLMSSESLSSPHSVPFSSLSSSPLSSSLSSSPSSSPSSSLSAVSRKKIWLWQVIGGLSMGIAVTVKYNAIYIIIPFLLMALADNKWQIKKTVKDVFWICCIGLLFFIAYVIFGMLILPDQGSGAIHFFSWYEGFLGKYRPEGISLLGLVMFLLWSTPLFMGLLIFALLKEKTSARPFLLWVGTALLFYNVVITYGAMDRYFMNTIPALAILGGIGLGKYTFTKREIAFGSVIIILVTDFLFFLNSLPVKPVPRFPEIYLQELLNRNAAFLFSYTSSSGPTFGVSFAAIFFSFLLCGYAIVWLLWSNWKLKRDDGLLKESSSEKAGLISSSRIISSSRKALVLFLSVALAFNIFLVAEYLFHPTSADVSKVKQEMIDYVQENNLPFPVYSNDEGVLWYFDHLYWFSKYERWPKKTIGAPDNELASKAEQMLRNVKARGGTAVLVYWPPFPEKSPAWTLLPLCRPLKTFSSKEIVIGEIYRCSPQA